MSSLSIGASRHPLRHLLNSLLVVVAKCCPGAQGRLQLAVSGEINAVLAEERVGSGNDGPGSDAARRPGQAQGVEGTTHLLSLVGSEDSE